jgi:hypothetical protein
MTTCSTMNPCSLVGLFTMRIKSGRKIIFRCIKDIYSSWGEAGYCIIVEGRYVG